MVISSVTFEQVLSVSVSIAQGLVRNTIFKGAHLTLETLSQPYSRLDPCGNPQTGLSAGYRFW